MVGDGQQVRGDVPLERPLGLQRRLRAGRQPDALRDAEDMRVDRHHLALPQHRTQHVGRLAPHARKPLHRLEVGGHLAAELRTEHAGHAGEVLRLVVGVGDAPDVGENLLGGGGGHRLGGGEGGEEGRRGHVDPLVGALRRENHRNEQLEGVFIVEFALGHGHVFREPGDYAVVTLAEGHGRFFRTSRSKRAGRSGVIPANPLPCAGRGFF